MRPTQCIHELYLTIADSLAPLLINNNNKKFFQAILNCGKQKRSSKIFREVSGVHSNRFLSPFWDVFPLLLFHFLAPHPLIKNNT